MACGDNIFYYIFIVNNSVNTQTTVKISLILIFLIQIYWSVSAINYDFSNNYSASKDVAEFLKENDYENKTIYGLGYSVTAIQPYFEKNIFANQNTNKSFYLWKDNNGYDTKVNDNVDICVISALYINSYKDVIEWLKSNDYREINFEGYTYLKNNIYESEGYKVYIK